MKSLTHVKPGMVLTSSKQGSLHNGKIFLGVTRMLPDSELGTLLARSDQPLAAVNEVVALAVRRGGPDNATAVAFFAARNEGLGVVSAQAE